MPEIRAVDAFAEALRKGREALARGENAVSQREARTALKLRPGDAQAQHLMGMAFFGEGQFSLAFEVFEKLSGRYATSVAIHVNAGLAALYGGRSEEALTHLQLAVGLDPHHGRAFAYLGLLHLDAGDLELARAALLEAGLLDLGREVQAGADREALCRRTRVAASAVPPGGKTVPPGGKTVSPGRKKGESLFAEVGSLPALGDAEDETNAAAGDAGHDVAAIELDADLPLSDSFDGSDGALPRSLSKDVPQREGAGDASSLAPRDRTPVDDRRGL
ncbi:MAG: tetratricopeptide repeat protein, partial [Deltaproteobacteria bacterium]|nr:tetratricopeptide repeat protein [Deltaproteobacteria bacterium]